MLDRTRRNSSTLVIGRSKVNSAAVGIDILPPWCLVGQRSMVTRCGLVGNGDAVVIGRKGGNIGVGALGKGDGRVGLTPKKKRRARELALWPLRPKAEWQAVYGCSVLSKFGSVREVRGNGR
jgi:hypothetical protein